MKKTAFILLGLALTTAVALATDFVRVHLFEGEPVDINIAGLKITFSNQGSRIHFGDSISYDFSEVDSISFHHEADPEPPVIDNDSVYLTWNGTTVTVDNPWGDSIQVVNQAGVVTLTNTMEREISYVLQGSGQGSFKLYSPKKQKLFLRNLTLTSKDGGVINIQSKKTTAVKVQGTNTLTDASTYSAADNGEDMKGCIFSEGQLEFEQSGSLVVNANYKHGICSDDYIEMKNCSITIAKTAKNAIHTNDYFTMKSGILTLTTSANGAKGIKSDGPVTIKNGTVKITQSGTYLNESGDVSYVTSIKGDTVRVMGGNITINSSATAGKGLSADALLVVEGGEINATMTGAAVTNPTNSSDYITAKAFDSDAQIQLLGGNITLKASGSAGKGIKCDGNLIIGKTDGTGPQLTVATTGSAAGSSSGGGGGGRPGGGGGWPGGGGGFPGGESSSGSSAKAIKCQGEYYQYGGDLNISTASSGAEGIESKTKSATSMNFIGGTVIAKCYDDCINSAGAINFKGSKVLCIASNNDAVDSNYGRSGAIAISGGIVVAISLAGSPEEGLDCDNNSYISVNGGRVFSAGGAQGGGGGSSSLGTSSQSYAVVTSGSYTTNRYYTLADASGNNLFTFKWIATKGISSTLSVISAPEMKKSSTYNLKYSTTAPTDATEVFADFFYLGSSAKGTSNTVSSITAK